MLMLVCKCGHSGPFPTEDIALSCSRCKRKIVIRAFATDADWEAEQRRRLKAGESREWRVEWQAAANQARPEGASQH